MCRDMYGRFYFKIELYYSLDQVKVSIYRRKKNGAIIESVCQLSFCKKGDLQWWQDREMAQESIVQWVHHEGSIDPRANALTTEVHLAPYAREAMKE